ncbi:hypothetical protein M124_3832, partial [Bacteroides fragilis str. 3988T(B)14]
QAKVYDNWMFRMEVIHQNQHYTGNLLLAFCQNVF